MTQVTTEELAKVVCPQARKAGMFAGSLSPLEAALMFAVLVSGIGLGKLWRTGVGQGKRWASNSTEVSGWFSNPGVCVRVAA